MFGKVKSKVRNLNRVELKDTKANTGRRIAVRTYHQPHVGCLRLRPGRSTALLPHGHPGPQLVVLRHDKGGVLGTHASPGHLGPTGGAEAGRTTERVLGREAAVGGLPCHPSRPRHYRQQHTQPLGHRQLQGK